jgi:predicted porin
MRGFRVSSVYWAAPLAVAVSAIPTRALADVTLFEKGGWSFHTSGLVAAHYQLIKGDADPTFSNGAASVPSSGGQIQDERTASDQRDNSLTLSNIRSGFIGTQIGFGLNREISPTVHVESLLSINMVGINSNRGQNLQKDVDYREAWAQVVSPYGSVRFGRMFGIFGEGSAEVMLMAFRYGVGHPCVINHATISCGSSGAGPIYAGFDGAIRYISPRLAGFELALSVVDPSVSPSAKMSPYPRVDTEINFDQTFDAVKIRLIGQSMLEQIGKSTAPAGMTPGTVTKDTIWGAMGTGIVSVGGFGLGGGGWTGAGVGERIPLEASDPANPISNDGTLELRHFRGFYGNAQFEFMDNSITAGGGILYVQPTALDAQDRAAPADVLKTQFEYHVTYHHKFDAIVLNAEYMHWESKWHFGEVQKLNFFGAGINYLW